jgi:hypothetical protein
MWSVPRSYEQRTKLVISLVELCMGGCEERTWAREAEEYPLLEAITRERPVKIQ